MAEKLAKVLLKEYLGEFLQDIDSEHICVALWSGNLSLENLNLKASAFDKFNLPLKVVSGTVGNLNISLPYKSILLGISSPVTLFLENIKIYLKTNQKEDWNFIDFTNHEYKCQLVKSYVENLILKMKLAENPNINNTYLKRMVQNVIDNIIISIKNFTFILEDSYSHQNYNFFLGLDLTEISIQNFTLTNNKLINDFDKNIVEIMQNSQVKCSKIFQIVDLSVFLIPFKKKTKINLLNLDKEFINLLSKSELIDFSDECENRISNYFIFNKINLSMKFIINDLKYKYQNKFILNLFLKGIDFELEKKQLVCLLKLIEFFNSYKNFNLNCYKYRRLQYNKPENDNISNKKGPYLKKLFQFYINQILIMIKEKKKKKILIKLTKEFINNSKKDFKQLYQTMYINPDKLSISDKNTLNRIIRLVDAELLYEWLNEIVPNIYAVQKYMEKSSGFFGGVKSYFFSSALENIKLDPTILKEDNDLTFYFNYNSGYCSISLSENQEKGNQNFKEITRFIIRNLYFNCDNNSICQNLTFEMEEAKLSLLTLINKSFFNIDLLFPVKKLKSENFRVDYIHVLNKSKKVKINLYSHSFIYNQKFVQFIMKFFEVNEFQYEISNVINTQILADEILDNKKIENEIQTKYEVFVDRQILVLPLNKKSVSDSDVFLVNMGSIRLINDLVDVNKRSFVLTINDINLEYAENLSDWINSLEKINYILPTYEIIEKIYLDMKIESLYSNKIYEIIYCKDSLIEDNLSKLRIETNLSPINIKINQMIFQKLIKIEDIFKPSIDDDIWEQIYTNKKQILDNATKKGSLKFQSSILENWNQFYCLVSLGFLYLYDKPDNYKPSLYISLRNAEISDCFQETKVENSFRITNLYTNTSYYFAVSNEKLYKEWKKSINDRIYEIKIFSDSILESQEKAFETIALNENSDALLNKYTNLIKKIEDKSIINNVYFKFSLDVVNLNLVTNEKNINDKLNTFSLNLTNFFFSLNQNEIETKVLFTLSNILLNTDYIVNPNYPNVYKDILWNDQIEKDDNLIKIELLFIDSNFNDFYLNNSAKFNDKEINLVSYNCAKTQIRLNFGSIHFYFNPLFIKTILQFFTIEKKETQIFSQRKFSQNVESPPKKIVDLALEEISLRRNSCKYHREKHINVNVNLKSLEIVLINYKTQINMFSFFLSESSFFYFQMIDHYELNLTLGFFRLYENMNFPKSFMNIEEQQNSTESYFKEIIGPSNIDNKSSLQLKFITCYTNNCLLYNETYLSKMKLTVFLESIKVLYYHTIIMRFIDYISNDLIESFVTLDNQAKIVGTLKEERKNEIIDEKNDTFRDMKLKDPDLLVFYIVIDNPKLILMDDSSYFENYFVLDFGKAEIRNSLILQDNNYFQIFELIFNKTNISKKDKTEICEPMHLSFNLKTNLEYDYTEINVIVNKIYFKCNKEDYIQLVKILNDNFLYDDDLNNIYFELNEQTRMKNIEKIENVITMRKINIEFHNEIFILILFNKNFQKELELFLLDTHFSYEKFLLEEKIQSRSKSIYIKERDLEGGQVLILYNKKGLIMEKIKDYIQFEIIVILTKTKIEVNVYMEDLKIFLEFSIIPFLTDFFQIPDKKDLLIQIEHNTIDKIKTKSETTMKEEETIINICIVNNIVFFRSEPHLKSQRILAAEGDILIGMNQFKNKFSKEMKLKVNLSNFNFYSTKIYEFNSNFEEFEKRTLVDPMNLYLNIDSKNLINEMENSENLEKNEILIEIEKIKFKITYEDTSFITYAVLTNLNEFNNNNDYDIPLQTLESFNDTTQIVNLNMNNIQKKNKNKFEITLLSKGIEFYLINDLSYQYFPIFHLTFNNFKVLLMNRTKEDVNFNCTSSLKANYFNSKISLWEPFLEKISICLSYNVIEKEEKPIQNIIIVLSDLNVNLSDEFVKLIATSINDISDNLKTTIKKNTYERVVSEIKVSNYFLKNYSGEKIYLSNGNLKDILVENNEEYDLSNLISEETSNNKIYSTFKKDFSTVGGYYIEKIYFLDSNLKIEHHNINQIKTKEYKLKDQLEIETQKNSSIIYSVDLNKMNRTYYFFSNLLFENFTNFNISLIIVFENNTEGNLKIIDQYLIKSCAKIGIPQKYINYRFYFKIESNSKVQNILSFPNIIIDEKIILVTVDEYNLCLKKEKLNIANSGVYLSNIHIYSPLVLENYLPFKLEATIFHDSGKTTYEIKENSKIEINKNREVNSHENFEIVIRVSDHDFYSASTFKFYELTNESYFIENSVEEVERDLVLTHNVDPEDKIYLKLIIYIKAKSSFCFAFVSEYFFVNSTDLKGIEINYLSNKKTSKELTYLSEKNGYLNYKILPGIYEKFHFQFKTFSSENLLLSIENVAVDKEVVLNDYKGYSKYQFVLKIDVYYLKFNLIKKIDVLHLMPKFVIKNNLPYQIMIKEYNYNNADGDNITIKSESENHFHFSKNSNLNNQSLSFAIINKLSDDSTQITEWSDFINFHKALNQGIILKENVLLNSKRNLNRNKEYFINIQIDNSASTKFIVISETNNDNCIIFIKNQCENFMISLYHIQNSKDIFNTFSFSPNEFKFFNWSKISDVKYLKIDLKDCNKSNIEEYYILKYDPSLLNFSYFFEKTGVNLKIYYQGGTQIFQFKETNKARGKSKLSKSYNILQFLILIENINISLIGNIEEKRDEIINLNLKKINFLLLDEIRNAQRYFKVHFKVLDIQLDNFISKNSPYKVALFKLTNDDSKNEDFIQMVVDIKQNKNINIIYFENIDFLIQSFAVCLDSDLLFNLFIFLKNFNIVLDKSFVYENVHYIFEDISKINSNKYLDRDISKNKQKIYFEFIRTSPINFLLSFKNLNSKFFRELNIKSKIIQNILDVFSNNEKVNIRLKSIEMAKVFGNFDKIIHTLKDYYKFNLMTQAVKLLFSIDILGNPIGLLENIAGGVKDFFYLPIQGFVKGPIYFLKGGAKGTKSLISHAIGGAFDSAQKISSSLGRNILKLTDADEYMFERQKLIKSEFEKSLINKIRYSLVFIYLGFKFAFKDFFVLPYSYTRRDGIKGLPKGIFFGFTSAFIKPINGGLDLLSFISGHIALKFLENYNFSKYETIRLKRMFWGNFEKIKSIGCEDEYANLIMNSINISNETNINPERINYSYTIHNCFIYYSYAENELKNIRNFNIIVFFNNSLGIYNVVNKAFIQIIQISNITNLKTNGKKVEIEYKPDENRDKLDEDSFNISNYNITFRDTSRSYQLNFEFEELKEYFISFMNFIKKNH